ncbi:hypothetical protein CEXT_791781 [Caerostris extrusa]|uniref:Uncharacterized protein n=1 Tax=Caerostris extrusa TaxID=172846 RepID=A0AAV4VA84_CAEEX|nr:hypothetical protein CEXT_791781 [Caerostris extrusa]
MSPGASGPSKSGGGFVKVDSFILSERQSGRLKRCFFNPGEVWGKGEQLATRCFVTRGPLWEICGVKRLRYRGRCAKEWFWVIVSRENSAHHEAKEKGPTDGKDNYLSPDASGPSKSEGGFVKVDSFILPERQSGRLKRCFFNLGEVWGRRSISDAMFCHTGSPPGNLWSEKIKLSGQVRKRTSFGLFCHVSSMDVLNKNSDYAG